MKKIIFLFSLLFFLFTCLKAQTPIPNSNLTWKCDSTTKTIIIDGSGDMPIISGNIPWDTLSTFIENVDIKVNVTSICDFAFNRFTGLKTVNIEGDVRAIGHQAFYGCSMLSGFTFPNSVTTIGSRAFYECSSLSFITFGNNLKTIENYAFHGCSRLTNITFPNNVENIGEYAFAYCLGLESITIGEKVRIIGKSAFQGCTKITSITSNTATVPTLGNDAFKDVDKSKVKMTVPTGSELNYANAPGWSEFDFGVKVDFAEIITQPVGAYVCSGSNYELSVSATGTDLMYQWYHNDNLISDATDATYTITNMTNDNTGSYHVSVKASIGQAVTSLPVYVGIATPLPDQLSLASTPEGNILEGREYDFKAYAYEDVTLYTWSTKYNSANFLPKTGLNTKVTFIRTGSEIIYLKLSHPCGERVIEYPVNVLDKNTANAIIDEALTAFPNPVRDILTLKGLKQNDIIRIYTVTGTTIATYKADSDKMTIDLTHFQSGIYYINTNGNNLKIIKK